MVPAGTVFNIFIYDIHHNPDVHTNPDKFDPDRFTEENISARHHFSYLPFSAGSRNCIGQKYAMLEMKTILATILINYSLIPITKLGDVRFCADLVLRTVDPIRVKFLKRQL